MISTDLAEPLDPELEYFDATKAIKALEERVGELQTLVNMQGEAISNLTRIGHIFAESLKREHEKLIELEADMIKMDEERPRSALILPERMQ